MRHLSQVIDGMIQVNLICIYASSFPSHRWNDPGEPDLQLPLQTHASLKGYYYS